MAEKTYVARRDGLKVGTGVVNEGEAFPAAHVTSSLIGTGWVAEGTGAAPRDGDCHGQFDAQERGAWGKTKVAKGARPVKPPPAGLAGVPLEQLTSAPTGKPKKVHTAAKASQRKPAKR